MKRRKTVSAGRGKKTKARSVTLRDPLQDARETVRQQIERAEKNPYPSLCKGYTLELLCAIGELLLIVTATKDEEATQ